MRLARFWQHILMSPMKARRAFGPETLESIAKEVSAVERTHRGEILFVVEAELASGDLWRGVSSRRRARWREVTSRHRSADASSASTTKRI